MGFESISLFDWRPVGKGNAQTKRRGEFLSILDDEILISKDLYEKFGTPDKIAVAVDRKKKMLGVRPTKSDDTDGIFFVSFYGTGGTRVKNSVQIIYEIERCVSIDRKKMNYRIFPSDDKRDGYYAFDLEKITSQEVRHRIRK